MELNTVTWAIIVGLVLLVALLIYEQIIAKRKNKSFYTLSDSITNLSCGILERLFNIFLSVIILFGFNFIQQNWAIYQIPVNIYTWLIALVLTDFIAYWFHRKSHEINFLWAAHIVHHQSEQLNVTTVFRVAFIAVIFRSFFFVGLAFAGFDVFTIVSTSFFLGFFQFFTHSRAVGKLGFIESFMTTPSHHRVHHARNVKYMDRNYGHIFIVWDRLFGTFVEEQEEPDYGITSGFESANPFDANFSYWKNLFTRARHTHKLIDKIKVFTMGPTWTPQDTPHLDPLYKVDAQGERLPHVIPVDHKRRNYLLWNLLLTVIAFVSLFITLNELGEISTVRTLIIQPKIMSLVYIILISLFAHAKFIANSSSAARIDSLRLTIGIGLLIYGFKLYQQSWIYLALAISVYIFTITWLFLLKKIAINNVS